VYGDPREIGAWAIEAIRTLAQTADHGKAWRAFWRNAGRCSRAAEALGRGWQGAECIYPDVWVCGSECLAERAAGG